MWNEIKDFAAPELDVYARTSEVQLLRYYEPEPGIFIAAVLNPRFCRICIPSCGHTVFLSKYVQGIWNTVPMLTLAARR